MYITFVTSKNNLSRQIKRQGFIVWIDPEGGSDKQYAIKIEPKRSRTDTRISRVFLYSPAIEKFTPFSLTELNGFSVALKQSYSESVLELRIPRDFSDDAFFPIRISNKSPVSIGFETPETKRRNKMSTMNRKRGRSENRTERKGNRRSMQKPLASEPFKTWVTVRL